MKSSLLTAIILVSLALTTGAEERLEPGSIIPWADPTIIVENGRYYLTGTNNSNTGGFQILESTDLISWNYVENGANSFIIRKGPDTFGNHSFWAPQILRHNGRYLLTYSAEARMCIAESNQPYGPYRQRECRPISDTTQMNIDTFLLLDDDGRWYMFHARYEQQGEVGGNTIQVAEFDFDKQRLVDSTLTLCLKVAEPWEYTDDGRKHNVKTLEGPTVIKHDGTYYLFYSANDYQSIDYSVGVATATSPYGPWTRQETNPIIHRSIVGENGAGHGDFFIGLDGRPYYVYHVHHSAEVVHPREVRIVPLSITKNETTGLLTITADNSHIIVPHISAAE